MAVRQENSFAGADWAVFAGLLILLACIGVYYALTEGKQKTTKEFLMANHNLKIVPVAVSILVSFLSAILILGAPAEMYFKGTQYYLYVFGQMTAVVLATVLFVPLFYPLELTSMYQYYELRFKSRAVRLTATIINILSALIFMGIASFAPATALEAMSGFPEWASFLLIGFVCTFYTFMGGIKAVVQVNAFQGIIMFGTLLTIVIKASVEVGGFKRVWEVNEEWGRINFWNFDVDPTVRHTFWALTFGGMMTWVGAFGASQQSIQRFSTLSTLREAKIAVLLNCVGIFLMVSMACLAGITVFAFYAIKGCDPSSNGEIRNPNQIIPFFVIQMLHYPGVPGLFIAGLFSGAFSSVSSNLSSLVATSWEDIIKPHVKNKSEITHAWITRVLVIIFGVVGVGISFAVRKLGGTVLQVSLSFMGAGGGALNGFVVLGAFFPSCNRIGAIAGPLVSYAVMMWIGIGKYTVLGVKEDLQFPTQNCSSDLNFTTPVTLVNYTNVMTTPIPNGEEESALHGLYSLSYLWYSTLGLMIAVSVGLVVSALTGPMKVEEVDPRYLIPVCDRLCCYLPKSFREYFYCGARYDEEPAENGHGETGEFNSRTQLGSGEIIDNSDVYQLGGKSNIHLKSIKPLSN